MSLSRNFIYNLQTFRGFRQEHFYDFVANSAWSNFLPASKHQQTKVRCLVGICLYDCFIHLSSGKAKNAFGTTAVWWLWHTASQVCIKCRRLNLLVPKPVFFFFSGDQKVDYRYFCLVRFHFFLFSLALFPKGWLAVFFLPSRTILQVACGTPSTIVAVVGSYRLNYCWCYCFALQTKKMTLKNLVPNPRLKFCCLSCPCAVTFVRIRKRHG